MSVRDLDSFNKGFTSPPDKFCVEYRTGEKSTAAFVRRLLDFESGDFMQVRKKEPGIGSYNWREPFKIESKIVPDNLRQLTANSDDYGTRGSDVYVRNVSRPEEDRISSTADEILEVLGESMVRVRLLLAVDVEDEMTHIQGVLEEMGIDPSGITISKEGLIMLGHERMVAIPKKEVII